MRESPNQRLIWMAAAALSGVILFRVNSGMAWAASAGRPRRLPDGDVVIPGGRPLALGFGLINGKPVSGVGDLCGWRTITITPEMVGCRVAVFASIECKRPDSGRTSDDQRHWRDTVLAAGGIACVASDADEARNYVSSWHPPRTAGGL